MNPLKGPFPPSGGTGDAAAKFLLKFPVSCKALLPSSEDLFEAPNFSLLMVMIPYGASAQLLPKQHGAITCATYQKFS